MASVVAQLKQPGTNEILAFLRKQQQQIPHSARSSAAGDGKETVTQGLSGLSPGDRLAVESFHRKRKHTDDAVADKETRDGELLTDGERDATSLRVQIGTPYHSQDISRRLRRLNENFIFEQSIAFPDIMGIYVPDASATMRNGRRLRHVIGFEYGFSPEFSVYHPHATGPKKVTRGWRALIWQLSRKGYINLNSACLAFGIEIYSQSSERWRRELGLDRMLTVS